MGGSGATEAAAGYFYGWTRANDGFRPLILHAMDICSWLNDALDHCYCRCTQWSKILHFEYIHVLLKKFNLKYSFRNALLLTEYQALYSRFLAEIFSLIKLVIDQFQFILAHLGINENFKAKKFKLQTKCHIA